MTDFTLEDAKIALGDRDVQIIMLHKDLREALQRIVELESAQVPEPTNDGHSPQSWAAAIDAINGPGELRTTVKEATP